MFNVPSVGAKNAPHVGFVWVDWEQKMFQAREQKILQEQKLFQTREQKMFQEQDQALSNKPCPTGRFCNISAVGVRGSEGVITTIVKLTFHDIHRFGHHKNDKLHLRNQGECKKNEEPKTSKHRVCSIIRSIRVTIRCEERFYAKMCGNSTILHVVRTNHRDMQSDSILGVKQGRKVDHQSEHNCQT